MNGRQSTLLSARGMVAAAHPLAAAAGSNILNGGGNAFDAATATAAALSVVEPYMSGPGGMGIAICYINSEQRVRVLDFVPRFPSAFHVSHHDSRPDLRRGALGVGLPGCLIGWAELSDKYGSLPLEDALKPAIELARRGFPITDLNVAALDEARREFMSSPLLQHNWSMVYGSLNEKQLCKGTLISHLDLARTYETVAEKGVRHFYEGEFGSRLIRYIRSLGGVVDYKDVELIEPTWHDPIALRYCGHTIYTSPPPSHGSQFLITMKLLGAAPKEIWHSSDSVRLDALIRVCRAGANMRAQRYFRSAGDFWQFLEGMGGRDWGDGNMTTDLPIGETEHTSASPDAEMHENTTSFTTADSVGNMVVVTQSLGQYFGSGLVVPGTGVWLNDLLHYSFLTARKGLVSSPDLPICPSIVISDQNLAFAFGTPGSFGISQTQVQVLTNLIHRGMNVQEAIDAPRFRVYAGARVVAEERIDPEVIDLLSAGGHQIELTSPWSKVVGGVQGILRDLTTGVLVGGADLRRDGYVAVC